MSTIIVGAIIIGIIAFAGYRVYKSHKNGSGCGCGCSGGSDESDDCCKH